MRLKDENKERGSGNGPIFFKKKTANLFFSNWEVSLLRVVWSKYYFLNLLIIDQKSSRYSINYYDLLWIRAFKIGIK